MADLIAVQCPQCGADSPFSLATPDRLLCDYCDFVGPLPESAQQSLHYAAAVLPELEARHRNLSAKHRRALQVEHGAKVVRNVVIGVIVLAILFWDVIMVVVIATGGDAFVFGALGLVPTAIVSGTIVLAIRAGRTARAELAGLYAAAAPVRPGAPTRCRVCGAPLRSERDKPIVSCGFCASDNLVAREALAAATWHRTRSLEEYKAHIEARANRAFGAAAKGTAIVVGAAFGAPLASLMTIAVLLALYATLIKGHRTADETVKYTAVRNTGRWCIAEWKSGETPPGARKPFSVQALIGRKVHHEGRELDVSAASLDPNQGNILILEGLPERPVSGTCLVGEPP